MLDTRYLALVRRRQSILPAKPSSRLYLHLCLYLSICISSWWA